MSYLFSSCFKSWEWLLYCQRLFAFPKHCKAIIGQMAGWESLNNHLKHGGGSLFVPDDKILSSVKVLSVGLFRALKLVFPLSLLSRSQATPESTIFHFAVKKTLTFKINLWGWFIWKPWKHNVHVVKSSFNFIMCVNALMIVLCAIVHRTNVYFKWYEFICDPCFFFFVYYEMYLYELYMLNLKMTRLSCITLLL